MGPGKQREGRCTRPARGHEGLGRGLRAQTWCEFCCETVVAWCGWRKGSGLKGLGDYVRELRVG